MEAYQVGVEPGDALMLDPQPAQPLRPEVERRLGHREGHRHDLAAAGATAGPRRPAEKRHRRAGRAEVVGKVEVVGVGQVLVDALLDEAQPEHADVEVDVPLNIARDGGRVVDAGHGGGHGLTPFTGWLRSELMLAPHSRPQRGDSPPSRACPDTSSSTRAPISAARGSPLSSSTCATSPIARAITAGPRHTCQGSPRSPAMPPIAPVALTGSRRPNSREAGSEPSPINFT